MKRESQAMLYEEAPLSDSTKKALKRMGFVEMTPIQEQAIPPAMEGRDIVGQAATGTGKTAAFGVPLAEFLEKKQGVQAICLCPTRELAMQVAEEINNILRDSKMTAVPVFGGQPIGRQIKAIEAGGEIVVGTPGRVLDHLRRGTLKLNRIRVCILDEADEMLDMGFYPDIVYILRRLPEKRQTWLFSATMPMRIRRIAARYMNDPVEISLNTERLTVAQTTQVFYELQQHEKLDGLCRLLDAFNFELTLTFCRTKRECDKLARQLQDRGYNALAIHGDLTQSKRDQVMKLFRDNKLEILIATDIAARGLDISGITHVINYNLPQDPERYVHRIGRTGRAGREGVAITFVTPGEYYDLYKVQETANVQIWQEYLPTEEDIMDVRIEEVREMLDELEEEGELDLYREGVEQLIRDYDIKEVAAALLRLSTERARQRTKPVEARSSGKEQGMARLFVTVGRKDNVQPPDILEAISSEAKIPKDVIGKIDIKDRFTFVEVPIEDAERVIGALHQSVVSGRKVKVERAKQERGRR